MDVTKNLVVAIMAGGSGTRFWPMSTDECPKQFLCLTGPRTMLQVTRDRLEGLVPPERILVLTNARFADLVREQLPELPAENVIGEPMARDTSAAVALAAALVEAKWPGSVLVVLAADHTIETTARFQEIVTATAEAAFEEGGLYTFGIKPLRASTGYGYLELGETLGERRKTKFCRLARFREKPDQATADTFLASGKHLWNSGMFVWRTSEILGEIAQHLPEHALAMASAAKAWGSKEFQTALRAAFEPLPKVSIDIGVMEKAKDVRCAIADFEWNDVGGWVALEQVLEKDTLGNWTQGKLHALSSSGNVVVSQDPNHQVVCIGVQDLVVVTTSHSTLVCRKEDAERIKQVVEALRGA